jgi:hypothetical protein
MRAQPSITGAITPIDAYVGVTAMSSEPKHMSSTDSISAGAARSGRPCGRTPAADRAHDEADGEQDGGVQLLDDRIAAGKERRGEIQRKRRVGVEVVPLDEIADRPTKMALMRRRMSARSTGGRRERERTQCHKGPIVSQVDGV